jgi:hypothetical protein
MQFNAGDGAVVVGEWYVSKFDETVLTILYDPHCRPTTEEAERPAAKDPRCFPGFSYCRDVR